MKASFRIEGFSDLDKALGELPKAVGKGVLRRVGTRALEPMAETARRMAPDDPKTPAPDLKTSITVSSKQKSGRQSQITPEEKSTVNVFMGPTKDGYPEAIPQEFGAVQHPPHPYMRPAFEQHKEEAINIVADQLSGEIDKAAQRLARRAARLAARGA